MEPTGRNYAREHTKCYCNNSEHILRKSGDSNITHINLWSIIDPNCHNSVGKRGTQLGPDGSCPQSRLVVNGA